MTQLSKAEEELMIHIWTLEKAFTRDIINLYDNPKPAVTTIVTLLKRIREKGFIDFNKVGKAREYFPLIQKSDYCKVNFDGMVSNLFNNSSLQLASFFTRTSNLSKKELKELRDLIDQQIKKK